MLYLPPGYQSGSKLPMLVEVYGGPGFQKVFFDDNLILIETVSVYIWYLGWQAMARVQLAGLCSRHPRNCLRSHRFRQNFENYLLLDNFWHSLDPRGSGFQGDAWRHAVYRQFGTVEVFRQRFNFSYLVFSTILGRGHDIRDSFPTIIAPLCRPTANSYLGLELWRLPEVKPSSSLKSIWRQPPLAFLPSPKTPTQCSVVAPVLHQLSGKKQLLNAKLYNLTLIHI